jgi:integrase/recombinase XerD
MSKTNRSGKSSLLTQKQLEFFFGQLPEKYSLLSQVMYFTAGRVKEITSIRVRNINVVEGLLTIEKSSTKTKETRQIPLPFSLVNHLQEWIEFHSLQADDFVFFTDSRNTKLVPGQKPVTTQSVDQFFRKTFDWIGVDGASTHSLRRSRLTYLHIQQHWSLREIMDISGHKSIQSLQQYLDTDRKVTFDKYRQLMESES